jgi:hypothetical protein
VSRLSRLVLAGCAVVCALALVFAALSPRGLLRSDTVLPLAGLALALLALRARPVVRANVALMIVLGAVALYGAEFVLMPKVNTIRRVAEEAGRIYDARSKAQVVSDLRRNGADAYPAMHRGATTIRLDGRDVVPLGGISGVTSVMCNERGEYAIFTSDEHGFNNPPGLWAGPIDVAVVGDSYTMGWCVPPERNLVAVLRGHLPRTLNLGVGGNGPLTELATLREYLPPLAPPVVLWAYFENDLRDLEEEKASPLLLRYLTDSGSVGLAGRQRDVDEQLRAFVDSSLAARLPAGGTPDRFGGRIARKLGQFARLHHVRSTIAALRGDLSPAEGRAAHCCDFDLFARVLAEAQRSVRAWGGELHFVFIPTRERYHRSPPVQVSEEELAARSTVFAIADSLGVPIIDLDEALRRHERPETLYVYPGAHFDIAGYRAAADALLERIATASATAAARSMTPRTHHERTN